jgi:hypothetical protein
MRMVRLWAIDMRNLQMVLCGMTAVITSPVISFLNIEWMTKGEPSDNGLRLPDCLEEGRESIMRDRVVSSEAAAAKRVVETIPAVDRAYESVGQLCPAETCTHKKHLFTRILLGFRYYTQPQQGILNRILSQVTHFVWLKRVKRFYLRF